MACVVCLDDNEIRDLKFYYGCNCTVVPFHDDCWTLYDQNFKACPLCRKKIDLEITVQPQPRNQEGNLQPLINQPVFTRSQFITNYPYWNAFFYLFICGYSSVSATLLTIGLYKYYSQLDIDVVIYSFLFIVFNVYDIISVILDQTLGVLWSIQQYLFTQWKIFIAIFYTLVITRFVLSISCIIIVSFLETNPWTKSGYFLVSLQGLFMAIVGIMFCCK
jgi:hypothetical protein